jgi:hypothetical protein
MVAPGPKRKGQIHVPRENPSPHPCEKQDPLVCFANIANFVARGAARPAVQETMKAEGLLK